MSTIVIILIALAALLSVVLVLVFSGVLSGPDEAQRHAAVSDSLRSLVAAQRSQGDRPGAAADRLDRGTLAVAAAEEGKKVRRHSSSGRMSLERRLRFARWPITALQFRAIQLSLTVALFIPAYLYSTVVVCAVELLLVPALVNSILSRSLNKRFKAFDADYPVFLLQYVSLLKTGLNTMSGMEAAAAGLDENSLVRAEVYLLIERLKLGLSEEQAINAFGEDVAHPEIELFVQSLLLSRRVGGNLSSTLERLAKQVRKRQNFRDQAVSAIVMERSSMYAVAFVMTFLFLYMLWSQPTLVLGAFNDPLGWTIFQSGLGLIAMGFYWGRTVTNIKV